MKNKKNGLPDSYPMEPGSWSPEDSPKLRKQFDDGLHRWVGAQFNHVRRLGFFGWCWIAASIGLAVLVWLTAKGDLTALLRGE